MAPGTLGTFLWLLVALVARSAVVTLAATWWTRTAWARRRWVRAEPPSRAQTQRELVGAGLVIVVDAAVIAAALHAGLLTAIEPSRSLDGAAWVLGTFAFMFVFFEGWFYVTHRLFHTRALYFMHAQHHVARTAQPLSALSFSVLERLVLLAGTVGVAALLEPVYPIALRGLELYLWVNYALNVLAHSNVEVAPAWFMRSPLGRVFIATTFHALHHDRGRGHYGLFTRTLDRLLGTEVVDYEHVVRAAREGRASEREASVEGARGGAG